MMTQETPQPSKKASATEKSQKKSKPPPERKLPSGAKVDFGTKKTSSKKNQTTPSLPSGAKPVFNEEKGKKSGSTSKKNVGQSLPNGDKPSFGIPTPKAKSKAKAEDTYAGSSFHSSPAALNLPKPSFKTSPDSPNVTTNGSVNSPQPPHVHANGHISPQPPHVHAHAYAHAHAAAPQYPVQMYHMPPYGQPGFSYHANNQGFINYQYPPNLAYYNRPPFTNGHYAPQQGPHFNQQQSQPVAQPQQGQKITFNELLGSSLS